MTKKQHKEILKMIENFGKGFTQQQALNYLVELGTHNKDGSLTKEYGGK